MSAPDDYAQIDAVLASWWQGDTVSEVPVIWLADDERPITPESVENLDHTDLYDDHFWPVRVIPERVAIVTQTCDIARSSDPDGGQPLVQVCPVVDLGDSSDLANAQGGHSTHFAPLEALGPTIFADLRKCTTVEKSIIARAASTRRPGCTNDAQRARFRAAVARQRGRFAFPDDLTVALQPLRSRLRDKRRKNSPEARRISEVAQIRVSLTSVGSWFDEAIDVELVFLVKDLPPSDNDPSPTSDEARAILESNPEINDLAEFLETPRDPVDASEIWGDLVRQWTEKCERVGTVRSITARADSPDEFSIRQAWQMPRLDLDHLSESNADTTAKSATHP